MESAFVGVLLQELLFGLGLLVSRPLSVLQIFL
jgi:hypothetical protein